MQSRVTPASARPLWCRRSPSASGARVGGVLARDKRYKDRRIGFELLDLGSGATGMLADETGDGPQLGKYRVRLDDLDSVGAKAVENALNSDLIIVDEIGPMELSSRRFILAVEKAIASPKPMLVVLHEWSNHRLAKKIRGSFQGDNRDRGEPGCTGGRDCEGAEGEEIGIWKAKLV